MQSTPTRSDRILGSLLAGACGDALGAPVEFLGLGEIRARFGAGGIRDLGGPAGRITDDTQMTLFTVEGMILALEGEGKERLPAAVHEAYLRWLGTQGAASRHPRFPAVDPRSWLSGVPALNRRRAPGRTCLSALGSGRMGTIEDPVNDSKGCGGIMRVAPIGLALPRAEAFRHGAQVAAITHGHPSGYLSAGCLARICAELMEGAGLASAVAAARAELLGWPSHAETLRALDEAVGLASEGRPAPEEFEELGGAWVREEALAVSVCASLAAADLVDGIRLAVNHGGDSDSTGAIAGNILGAIHGRRAIPKAWLEALELREEIERLGREFIAAFWPDSRPPPV